MRRALWLFSLLITIGSFGQAQSAAPEITPDAHVTPQQIDRWQRSGDPRLIAWAAYFAARQHDAAGLDLVPALLDRLTPIQPLTANTDPASFDLYREADALLYTLIVTGGTAPAEALGRLAEVFPVQSLILAARLPVPDRTPLLLHWYSLSDQARGGQLTRTSAMLLSHAPPPGFGASIVQDTIASLHIVVVSTGYGFASGIGIGCGDGGSGRRDTTWPPLFSYHLQSSNPDPQARLLVQAGDIQTFYMTAPFEGGYGHCGNDQPEFHHAVISELLDTPEKTMSWQISTQETVEWVDPADFTAEVRKLVAAERAALDRTAANLARKGLITAADADPRARLVVSLEDHRQNASTPLPTLHFDDPRITLADANSPAP